MSTIPKSEYNRSYRAAHREALITYDRERYQKRRATILAQKSKKYFSNKEFYALKSKRYIELNRESIATRKRTYRQANRAKVNERNARYVKANPDRRRKWQQKWEQKHPEIRKQYWQKRRALELLAKTDIESVKEFYLRIEHQDRLNCSYCGKLITRGEVHIDHITPLSRGGEHCADNLAVACAHCNLSKNDSLLWEWPKCPEKLKAVALELGSLPSARLALYGIGLQT